ncbi:hypothetical protein GCM10009746_07890 [Microbacterium paludicola]
MRSASGPPILVPWTVTRVRVVRAVPERTHARRTNTIQLPRLDRGPARPDIRGCETEPRPEKTSNKDNPLHD